MEIYSEVLSNEYVLELLNEVQCKERKLQYLKNEMLNFEEVLVYLNVSKANLNEKISNKEFPFYVTEEERILFRKSELDYWIFSGKNSTTESFGREVTAFLGSICL